AFQAQGRTVTQTREPGGTPLAEQLRTLLLKDPMDAMTEALLMFAARRDHIVRVIRPALERGEVVLCDRFSGASFAYQGGGHGLDWQLLSTLEHWVQGDLLQVQTLLQPHLTLWFDLPPSVAAARLSKARVPDKFEAQPLAFFAAVAATYGRRCVADPERFARIPANQAADAVWAEVLARVRQKGFLP
ncbi:MAG: dTMP kinase, partial [Rhodoferax sp.]|nr:dTMP kinase [Rhodoferax sp.]